MSSGSLRANMHVSYFAIQVYFEYKGKANESMELSQLTFDAVRGRVDTEEGWWCRFSRQLDTRGSSCPLKGHLLHRPVTGR